MRKILFRAKAINRDPYYYNYRTSYQNDDWVYGLVSKVWSKYDEAEMTNENGVSGIEVNCKTLGQYTGLDDKNGVPIFEGDIVWFDGGWEEYGGNTFEVVFTNGCFYLGRNPDTVCFLLKAYIEWAEVIGNIYDNPELLK